MPPSSPCSIEQSPRRPRAAGCTRLYGGLLVAVVWQIGSQLLARFVVGGNYSAYGVVGSFIAMMLWVYWASMVLYLGAQFVEVLGNPNNGSNNGGPKSNPSGNTALGNTAAAAKPPTDSPATR